MSCPEKGPGTVVRALTGARGYGEQPRQVLLCSPLGGTCRPRAPERTVDLFGSGDGATGLVGELDDQGDDLVQIQAGGVELGGAGGPGQR